MLRAAQHPPAGAYFCRRPRPLKDRPWSMNTASSSDRDGPTSSRPAAGPLGGTPARQSRVSHRRRATSPLARAGRPGARPGRRALLGLFAKARDTRFGRDHDFDQIDSVADVSAAVPIRTYEALWDDYLRGQLPGLRQPDLARPHSLSRADERDDPGGDQVHPGLRRDGRSNRKAAQTMLAYHFAVRPDSRLFHGRLFFLGRLDRSRDRSRPASREGDLSGIAAVEVSRLLRPYTFPPLELALESDWDRKLSRLAETGLRRADHAGQRRAELAARLFQRLLERTGKSTIAEVWPHLEVVVHGGVKFDPYREAFRSLVGSSDVAFQEVYPCSEGFIAFGDPATGLLRLVFDHGIFYEFVPARRAGLAAADAALAGQRSSPA